MEYQGITAGLYPPVSLALAKAVERIPAAGTGSWLFEPKWDGFRSYPGRFGPGFLMVSPNERFDALPSGSRSGRRGTDTARVCC